MPASGRGTAQIFFTGTPSEEAGVAVTGLTGVDSTTHAEAWFQHGDSTASNGTDEHEEAAALCPLTCQVQATQISIKAAAIAALGTGFFLVHYNWSTP